MTYSDWRTLRLIDCPACGSHDTHTRDAPGGLEVACQRCAWRAVLPWTPELAAKLDEVRATTARASAAIDDALDKVAESDKRIKALERADGAE